MDEEGDGNEDDVTNGNEDDVTNGNEDDVTRSCKEYDALLSVLENP